MTDPGLGQDAVPHTCNESNETAMPKPCKEEAGWRRIVRNFTPS